MEFTEEEREEIRRMKSSPQLYNQVSFRAQSTGECICRSVLFFYLCF